MFLLKQMRLKVTFTLCEKLGAQGESRICYLGFLVLLCDDCVPLANQVFCCLTFMVYKM